MFVQVIQGRISDAEEFRAALDQWAEQLGPSAHGFLGSTAGVTADGIAVAIARFTDQEAARTNSARPEQHAWWMETAKLFSGDVTFQDCPEVYEMRDGGADTAGFVQVMQGRISDPDRGRDLIRRMNAAMQGQRPELLGGIVCLPGTEAFTAVFYFTSESEAHRGEQEQPSPEVQELLDEQAALMSDLRYLDLSDPWLFSPGREGGR